MRGHGFVLDKYSCHCKAGFYHPDRVAVNSFASKCCNAFSSDNLSLVPGSSSHSSRKELRSLP